MMLPAGINFAAEALDAQALAIGIAAVARAAACFLMCHDLLLLQLSR